MIKTYLTPTRVVFRKGDSANAEIGSIRFDTLDLVCDAAVTDEERQYMEIVAREYVPGEIYSIGRRREANGAWKNHTIVLGPPRDYTHEVTLHACGNPDFQQYSDIGPKKTVRCCGIDEAKKIVMDYQHRYEMGMGNCAKDHGIVWELPLPCGGKRKNIGAITYNGRYETVAEVKAWKAKIAAAFSKP